MKKFILLSACMLSILLTAQTTEPPTVRFFIKNISLLPKKVTLIAYSPGITGNSTYGYILLPGLKKAISYRIGTKLYIASEKQVGVVMSGNRIDVDKPFLVVGANDENKVFKVNN